MNSAENKLKNGGEITALLNQYLLNCHTEQDQELTQEGKKKKSKETVFPNLATLFGVTVDYLMFGEKKGIAIAGNMIAEIEL